MRPLQGGDEMRLQRVDRAGDEPRSRAEGKSARGGRVLDRAEWRGGRARATARRRRVLALGQSVDLVVEQNDVEVDVAAQHVQHVVAADGQAVAIARHHPYVEIGIRELDTGGNRRRAPMHGVETVRGHIVRKARRTADAAHEHGALTHESYVRARLLHRFENCVVAAARTPADLLVRGIIFGRELRVADRGDGHPASPPNPLPSEGGGAPPRMRCTISVTRNGFPVTLLNPSAGIRYSARSNFTSWPLFISGTSTRS